MEIKENWGDRPEWDEYFLNIAKAVSLRATCLRRKYGAVITKQNIIVSTGYNGAPRGMRDCLEEGECTRMRMNVPHGQRYELCHSVHAEANSIIRASMTQLEGSTIYIAGTDNETGECDSAPCMMCKRMILNSSIERAVYADGSGGLIEVKPDAWLEGGRV